VSDQQPGRAWFPAPTRSTAQPQRGKSTELISLPGGSDEKDVDLFSLFVLNSYRLILRFDFIILGATTAKDTQ
jgi:hypothetical protein